MATVFVSHSSEDAEFIEREIIPLLKSCDLDVWYSSEAIQTTEEFERSIKRGLESSDWFLLALSPRSARSKWVYRETSWAFRNRDGRIILVIVEPCDPDELYLGLSDLEFVDFRRDRQKGVDKLLDFFDNVKKGKIEKDVPKRDETTPDNSMLKGYAHRLMLKGDFDGAITELVDAIELSPKDSGAYFLRGTCYLGKSNWDGAIADFSRAIGGKLNPLALSLAYMYRGRAHAAKNDHRNAIADCNDALRADPNNGDAYLLRGKLRRLSLERDAAVADLTEATKLMPTSSEAFLQRYHAFRDIGDSVKAKADYDEAVRLDPEVTSKIPAPITDGLETNAARIEEALRSLQAVGFLTQMDNMTPAAKQRALMELMQIGFPKVWEDIDYLIKNLSKDRAEYKLAVMLEGVARTVGLKK